MKIYTRICQCGRKKKPEFKVCWRCHEREKVRQDFAKALEKEKTERERLLQKSSQFQPPSEIHDGHHQTGSSRPLVCLLETE